MEKKRYCKKVFEENTVLCIGLKELEGRRYPEKKGRGSKM